MEGIRVRRSARALTLIGAATALIALGIAGSAAAKPYAPLSQKGPKLHIPKPTLRAAYQCTPGLDNAKREPVLLNPASGVSPDQNYSWNWEPALDQLGIPWCAYTAPNHTLGDIQRSSKYLVYGIRMMHRRAGRRIAVMGHSQGGMSGRWPLRFWPDTRRMVADVIGFAGDNHGSTSTEVGLGTAPPAVWQQHADSRFIAALNSRAETMEGISYTNIYTHRDEIVTPNDNDFGSSSLHTGRGAITNVATQDVCPLDIFEHLLIGTVDNVAYSLGVDALTHRGPAKRSRIPASVCTQPLMPGVTVANLNAYLSILAAGPGLLAYSVGGINIVGVEEVPAEPPLRGYVFKRRR